MKLTPNFSDWEFFCHDENHTPYPKKYADNIQKLANILQVIRDVVGRIDINSGYRTKAYNRAIGGAELSQHLYGKAADFTSRYLTPAQLGKVILRLIKEGKIPDGGFKQYNTWVHYDIGRARRW